jgi:hypothetical protein
MTQTLTYQQMGRAERSQAHALFAQTIAPLLAASKFLDVLNVFLFFLQIFSAEER